MKLFRKLTVLALAVLLVCALSAAAVAVNSYTEFENFDDVNYVACYASITVSEVYGEITNGIEVPTEGQYEISFETERLYHAQGPENPAYTDFITEIYDGNDPYQFSKYIFGNGSFYFSELTCHFSATVSNPMATYYFEDSSEVLHP